MQIVIDFKFGLSCGPILGGVAVCRLCLLLWFIIVGATGAAAASAHSPIRPS
jgi:hypothetical protein